MHELTPVALDRYSRRDPIGKSSPKDFSRSARPPKMSQVTTKMKREQNWRLEKRIMAKEIETEKY
jgi:hypothetical protein